MLWPCLVRSPRALAPDLWGERARGDLSGCWAADDWSDHKKEEDARRECLREKLAGPVSPTIWQWVLGARGWEKSPDLDHQLQRPQRRSWTVSKLGTEVQVEGTGGSKLRMSQGLSSLLRRKEWSLTLHSSFATLNKSLNSLTGSSVLYKVEAVITVL